MGCDIHLFIEYHKVYDPSDMPIPPMHWRSFGDSINPGRDYELFTLLAGVRGDEDRVVFPLRGAPIDMSLAAMDSNHCYVVEDGFELSNGYVYREEAEKWVKAGYSSYVGASKEMVTGPDWHSHSWLTHKEFLTVLERRGWDDVDVGYKVIAAVMGEFEKNGYDTRVVFWFDN